METGLLFIAKSFKTIPKVSVNQTVVINYMEYKYQLSHLACCVPLRWVEGVDIQQGPLSGWLRLHTLTAPTHVLLVFTFLVDGFHVIVSDMKNDRNALCTIEEAQRCTVKIRCLMCHHFHPSYVQKHFLCVIDFFFFFLSPNWNCA